jgi:hypothetical protein
MIVMPALLGCHKTDRLSIEGTVTLDGKPLEKGDIQFYPLPGTTGPSAGAQIVDGKFTIAPSGGTFAGSFVVEISSVRLTGRKIPDHRGDGMIDERVQYLPVRYNTQSELRAEVKSGESNHLEFAMKSK